MSRSINLSIPEHEKTKLTQLARDLGCLWGSEPSISQLVKAIAKGELRVAADHSWSDERIRALDQARKSLVDAGKSEEARLVAQLLIEQGKMSLPLRMELENFLQQPLTPWRQELDRLIKRHHPFFLTYRDAAERTWTYTVEFAEIRVREKREYLDCWCEETLDTQNPPELAHNRSLRLDRIQFAGVIPLNRPWRKSLDDVEMELLLTGGLALNYQPRPEDSQDVWTSSDPPTRQISRRVSYPFWVYRELLAYGPDCQILAPEAFLKGMQTQVKKLFDLYFGPDGHS